MKRCHDKGIKQLTRDHIEEELDDTCDLEAFRVPRILSRVLHGLHAKGTIWRSHKVGGVHEYCGIKDPGAVYEEIEQTPKATVRGKYDEDLEAFMRRVYNIGIALHHMFGRSAHCIDGCIDGCIDDGCT
jgi:hypothetical protein